MSRPLAYFLLILAITLWAGSTVTGRALHEVAGPVSINFWRWLAVTVLVAPFALRRTIRLWPTIRAHFWLLTVLTAAGVSLYQSAMYFGLRYTEAVNASIFIGAAPIFVVLGAWLIEGERMTARRWAGIALATVGMLVLAARGNLAALLDLEINIGDVIVLVTQTLTGVYVLGLKRLPRELAGVPLLFVAAIMGVIHLFPLLFVEYALIGATAPSPLFLAGVAYMVLFSSITGFLAWNAGAQVIDVSQTGAIMYLGPVISAVAAILVLDETFHLFHAIGIATILTGVVIATRGPQGRLASASGGSPAH